MKTISEYLSTKNVDQKALDGFPLSKEFDDIINFLKINGCVDISDHQSVSGFISETFEKVETNSKRFLVISNSMDGGKRVWICGAGIPGSKNPLFHLNIKNDIACNFRTSYTGMFNYKTKVTFEEFKKEIDKYIC